MAKFVKGDVVVIPFPFSDLSGSKKRPALVLADLPGNDILLCQITSQNSQDPFSIPIDNSNFDSGSLPVASHIRPTRIFTAYKNIILRNAGRLKSTVVSATVQVVCNLLMK
jgi:mRNA interferase MazF